MCRRFNSGPTHSTGSTERPPRNRDGLLFCNRTSCAKRNLLLLICARAAARTVAALPAAGATRPTTLRRIARLDRYFGRLAFLHFHPRAAEHLLIHIAH